MKKQFFQLLDKLKIIFNLKVEYSLSDINIDRVKYITYNQYNEKKQDLDSSYHVAKLNSDVVALIDDDAVPCRLFSQVAESHYRNYRKMCLLIFIEKTYDNYIMYFTSNFEPFNEDSYTSIAIAINPETEEEADEDLAKLEMIFNTYSFNNMETHVIAQNPYKFDFENQKEFTYLTNAEVAKLMIRTPIHEPIGSKVKKSLLIFIGLFLPGYLLFTNGELFIENKISTLKKYEARIDKDITDYASIKADSDQKFKKLKESLSHFKGVHYDH